MLRLFNYIDLRGSACDEAPAVKDYCVQRCEYEADSFGKLFVVCFWCVGGFFFFFPPLFFLSSASLSEMSLSASNFLW